MQCGLLEIVDFEREHEVYRQLEDSQQIVVCHYAKSRVPVEQLHTKNALRPVDLPKSSQKKKRREKPPSIRT